MMRAVVQRVVRASVEVDGAVVGSTGCGLCVLLGAMQGDTAADARFIAGKLATLRIFTDEQGRMNRSVQDIGGGVLLVSQFTLAADTTSGTRPGFSRALEPQAARELCEFVAAELRSAGLPVGQGVFGAHMQVSLLNDGPVTILLDSQAKVKR
jgi:D-tyrosyl-tRNA(Tyr) deacylase